MPADKGAFAIAGRVRDNFYGVFLGKREKARDICIAVDDGLWICASWPADSFPGIGLF